MLTVQQIAGWKPFSLVDVVGKITFTVWACGCNLKCPFCHNWRQAEWMECTGFEPALLERELEDAKDFVDYLHLTGGEPTLQPGLVKEIAAIAKKHSVPFSLNTNCSTLRALELIDLADHVAFDVKVPFEKLSGLPASAARGVWSVFERCVEKLARSKKPVEIRIPVAKGLTEDHADEVKRIVYKFDPEVARVVVNPLVGPPLTEPRDVAWCERYCYKEGRMSDEEEAFWRKLFPEYKVKVKRWLD